MIFRCWFQQCIAILCVLNFAPIALSGWMTGTKYPRPQLPPGAYCCSVNQTKLWTKQVLGLGPDETAKLRPLFDYKFLLPKAQLRAGLSYYGNAFRLRKFVSDLMDGRRPLKVGIVGGSISWGGGAFPNGVEDWFSVVSRFLTSVSKANVTARNGALPAVPSAYQELCLHNTVDSDVDLMFVEFSINDGDADVVNGNPVVRNMERLLRRIMDLPGRPAVVLMHVPHLNKELYEPFYSTCEDLEGALSAYYDVPALSSRTALYSLAVTYPEPGWEWSVINMDHHPGNVGHKAMADLAVHLIQSTALDLMHEPVTDAEQLLRKRQLPNPMYEGNLPPSSSQCLVGKDFKHLVKKAEGWSWINEGTPEKPKWGYVALTPGSKLIVRLNTARSIHRLDNATRIMVMFHYLTSYSPMGVASFECVAGCTCESQPVDAWTPTERATQTHVHGIAMSQSPECYVRIRVLYQSKSSAYKFKVSGVVLTDWSSVQGQISLNYWTMQTPGD